MLLLAAQKSPPGKASNNERALRVKAWQVYPENITVNITGYGLVRALNNVSISAEVSGRVVQVHPRLEVGEVIRQDEVLFHIDEVNYRSALEQAEAVADQRREEIRRLEKESAIDERRLKTLRRNRELARAEFERLQNLFEQHDVGTRSGVEAAEQAYNRAADEADLMAGNLSVYPQRIEEAKRALAQAKANIELAKANLKRCTVRAPFTGRVTHADIERGQYVSPGQSVLELADDSVLEIRLPLDSQEARKWLLFNSNDKPGDSAWFNGLHQVDCRIQWVEAKEDYSWTGQLHRVVSFEAKTRTLTVAVRISAQEAAGSGNTFPLVDGMFCSVVIPGRTLQNVYRVPREAVSFENTIFTSKEGRLKTVPVQVAKADADFAYISSGLSPGDVVITTRLIDPLENSLLEITSLKQAGTR